MLVYKEASQRMIDALVSYADTLIIRRGALQEIILKEQAAGNRPRQRVIHRSVVGRTAVRSQRRKAAGGGIKKSSDPEPAGPPAAQEMNITININSPLLPAPATASPPLPAPKGRWWKLTIEELVKETVRWLIRMFLLLFSGS